MADFNDFSQSNLPFSIEAEQSVLGSVLLDPAAISIIINRLTPEHFYAKTNREIYQVLMRMFLNSETIDVITLMEAVKRENIMEEAALKSYVLELAQIVPTTANLDAYIKILEDKFVLRNLIMISREIIENASAGAENPQSLLELAESRIYSVRQGKNLQGLTSILDVLVSTLDTINGIQSGDEKYQSVKSGISDLDRCLSGLNKSDLILLAARPGVGKTSFALNIARNVAVSSGRPVAFFSLEMSKEQLAQRLLSSEAQVSGMSFRTGKISDEEWVRIAQSAGILSKSSLYLDDSAGITVAEMKSRLMKLKNTVGLGLVVIDYLQLMTSGRHSENRVQEVSEITRGLKIMAKDLDVPVLTLSQLSRGPESRQDKRPMLSDLRESGSIEQDADIVLFLYRDDYYNNESDNPNTAECIIAKNRHGATDTVHLNWQGEFTRFTSQELYRNEP